MPRFDQHLRRTIPFPYNEKLASLLTMKEKDPQISEVVLLQAGPSFFAFEPVLDALKRAPIPLAHLITQPPPDKETEAKDLPPGLQVTVPRQETHLPQYVEAGGCFNLSFLCTDTPSRHPKFVVARCIQLARFIPG